MSLPAAAAPVAVLVLAWDETTPAVRALVEATEIATPLFDSVMVLVPAGPADAAEMSQEEFLPLAAPAELLSASDFSPTPAATDPLAPAPAAPQSASALVPAPIRASGPAAAPEAARPTAAAPATEAPALPAAAVPALVWAEVRVLRLSSFSLPKLAQRAGQALPQPIWRGDLVSPAAPYLGRVSAVDWAEGSVGQPTDYNGLTRIADAAIMPAGPAAPQQPAPGAAEATPPSYPSSELPALDAESDLAPVLLASEENTPEAAVDEEPLAAEFAAARAEWPAALAALRTPAPLAPAPPPTGPAATATQAAAEIASSAATERPAPTASPSAGPAPARFDAPNLNFQVIQYARFAVPVALAETPFEAIYAPAWPTWLAAQELRQRTGRPLVLHVSSLAAAEESVETAAGWQAELQRQALHRADLILTETPALAHRLRHELNLPAHLVRPVPAADAAAIAQALHTARPRLVAGQS